MPQGVRSYECIYCGSRFTRADAIAANTPELMSNMYCSRVCHDKDTEQIEHAIKELRDENPALSDGEFSDSTDTTEYKTVEVGGFRLRVPLKQK